ncbi:MAG: N-acetylglucosamine-6-phosphate deacetylase [Planctomycetota bacterium]
MIEIEADCLLQADRICAPARVSISRDGIIEELRPDSSSRGSGTLLGPGFVDLQVNGFGGVDLLSATPDEFRELARMLARTGVTSFLPTLCSAPLEVLEQSLRRLDEASGSWPDDAARPLGFHLEGPFLNPELRGAHAAEDLRPADPRELERLLDAGDVRLVTLAPEIPGAEELIRLAVERGVRVSLGHSMASHAEALRAVELGATLCTHFMNTMAPLHHREPALPGLALTDERVFLCLIPDLVHLHPAVLELALRARSARGLILVTDATAAAGCPDGDYRLGERRIRKEGDVIRDPDGRLAGSCLTMQEGVQRVRTATGAGWLETALASASNPARALGLDRELGSLAAGRRADILEWRETSPGETRLARVWLAGKALEPLPGRQTRSTSGSPDPK